MPRFVIKPTAGGNPTSITVWAGIASGVGSSKFVATYDDADGDFDADITCPAPLPTGAKLFLDVETTGVITTTSIDLK